MAILLLKPLGEQGLLGALGLFLNLCGLPLVGIRARALYHKYVEAGDLQINVSSSQKKRLRHAMMRSFDALTDVFSLFEDVIQELHKYLSESCLRFARATNSI